MVGPDKHRFSFVRAIMVQRSLRISHEEIVASRTDSVSGDLLSGVNIGTTP